MLAPLLYNDLSGGNPPPGGNAAPPTFILTHVQYMHGLSRVMWFIGLLTLTWKRFYS